jgi:hypothetical protein
MANLPSGGNPHRPKPNAKMPPFASKAVSPLARLVRASRCRPILASMGATLALVCVTVFVTDFRTQTQPNADVANKAYTDSTAGKMEHSKDSPLAAVDGLEQVSDDPEVEQARRLIRPLSVEGFRPLRNYWGQEEPSLIGDTEWAALWEVATTPNGRLCRRFIEELSRTPSTSRQFRDRAAVALHAAVGLDRRRRAEVEALLIRRIEDPDVDDLQTTDLALAAAGWDGLSDNGAGPVAWALTRVMADWRYPPIAFGSDPGLKQQAQGLAAVAGHLDAWRAASFSSQAATILAESLKTEGYNPDAPEEGLSAITPWLEPRDAKEVATTLVKAMNSSKDANHLYALAKGLEAVLARLNARDAARFAEQGARALLWTMRDAKEPWALSVLAQVLAPLMGRMQAKDAAPFAGQAATALVEAFLRANDDRDDSRLAEGLAAIASRLEDKSIAAKAADALVQVIKGVDRPFKMPAVMQALSALAPRLDSRDAVRTATSLIQSIAETKHLDMVPLLAEAFTAVGGHLETADADTIAAQIVSAFVQVLKGDLYYSRQGPNGALAQCLSALAERVDASGAAKVTTLLLQARPSIKHPEAVKDLARGLSPLAMRLEGKDAAQAAISLVQILDQIIRSGLTGELSDFAAVLPALAANLDAKDAERAAILLLPAIKDAWGFEDKLVLAGGLSVLTARMDAKDAATLQAQGAAILRQAMKDCIREGSSFVGVARNAPAIFRYVEGKDAVKVATVLLQEIKDNKELDYKGSAVPGLVELLPTLEPSDAAAFRSQAVDILLEAMKTPHYDWQYKSSRVHCLATLATHLKAKDTAHLATTIAQRLIRLDEAWQQEEIAEVADDLAAVASHLEASDAVRIVANFFADMRDDDPKSLKTVEVAARLLSAVPTADVPSQSTSDATPITLTAGTGNPLTFVVALAAQPRPCCLSSQQLVELLKMPTCIGKARRLVLDHLGNRYHRTFADVWEFVRYAEEHKLDLDLTSPPRRP